MFLAQPPCRLVHAVVETAEHVRVLEVALGERHQDLVPDLGKDRGASVLAGARLDGARPPRLVGVGEPRQLDLDPAQLVGVLGARDDGGDHAADPRPLPGDRVGHAVQRPLGGVAGAEARPVAVVRREVMPGGREHVLAGELVADADHLHGRPGPERGVAARRTLQLGEATRQVVGEGDGDGVRGGLVLEGREPEDVRHALERRGHRGGREAAVRHGALGLARSACRRAPSSVPDPSPAPRPPGPGRWTVIVPRRCTRLTPCSRTSGLSRDSVPPAGASVAGVLAVKWSLSSARVSTRSCSAARRRRKSQSLTPSWLVWSSGVFVASTLLCRPARCATFDTMSEAVMFT